MSDAGDMKAWREKYIAEHTGPTFRRWQGREVPDGFADVIEDIVEIAIADTLAGLHFSPSFKACHEYAASVGAPDRCVDLLAARIIDNVRMSVVQSVRHTFEGLPATRGGARSGAA